MTEVSVDVTEHLLLRPVDGNIEFAHDHVKSVDVDLVVVAADERVEVLVVRYVDLERI